MIRAIMPALWLIAYWYYKWAAREIDVMHKDVLHVTLRRDYYARLLSIPEGDDRRTSYGLRTSQTRTARG